VDPGHQLTRHGQRSPPPQFESRRQPPYQIENTGLKAFRVYVPTKCRSLRFQGETGRRLPAGPGAVTNAMQDGK